MKTINLKKYYYPLYETDTFIELPDEIADAIAEECRAAEPTTPSSGYGAILTRWTIPPVMEYHLLCSCPLRGGHSAGRRNTHGNRKKPMN